MIGVERNPIGEAENLLVFDPSSDGSKLKQHLLERNKNNDGEKKNLQWCRQVRRSASSLKNKSSFQLLYISPGIMTNSTEQANSKVLIGQSPESIIINSAL